MRQKLGVIRWNSKRKEQREYDWALTLILFLFFLVSCISIYSGQASGQYGDTNFLLQQIFWYMVGAVIIGVVMYFDSDQLKKLTWFLYGFGILLLLILAVAPETSTNTKNKWCTKLVSVTNWFHTTIRIYESLPYISLELNSPKS